MSSAFEPSEKPKIIVDDDWKTRVQQEREALRQGPQATSTSDAAAPAASAAADSAESAPSRGARRARRAEPRSPPQLPPASFSTLVTMLATQALAALGQVPLPGQTEPVILLDQAKHFIDLLGVLETKTKGHLSPEEVALLDNVLHELRMGFIAIRDRG